MKIAKSPYFNSDAERILFTLNEKSYIAEAMDIYGGSFVKSLAKMLRTADPVNTRKIALTWPDYIDDYAKQAINLKNNPNQNEL